MSYSQDRQTRLATRHSLQTKPLRSTELSAGAVHQPHVAQKSVGEEHLSPALLFEALAARPPSEGSVGSAHLDGELAGRVEELESLVHSMGLEVSGLRAEVSDLKSEVAYLRGILSANDML